MISTNLSSNDAKWIFVEILFMLCNLNRRREYLWGQSIRIWKGLNSYFYLMKVIKWSLTVSEFSGYRPSKMSRMMILESFYGQFQIEIYLKNTPQSCPPTNSPWLYKMVHGCRMSFLGRLQRHLTYHWKVIRLKFRNRPLPPNCTEV